MRQVGRLVIPRPTLKSSVDALRLAEIHQHTGRALAGLVTTGISKGVYRFASHEAMNRADEEALARVEAANARLLMGG